MCIITNLTYFYQFIQLRLVPFLFFGLFLCIFLTHAIAFATGLPQTSVEVHYLNMLWYSNLYSYVFSFFLPNGEGVNFVARYFSIFCSLISICLIACIVRSWTNDLISAFLVAVGFVIFPSIVYVSALATPHSCLMLLSSSVLFFISRHDERISKKVFSVIFFLCALMMALDPLGLVLGFLMLLFTMWRGGYINGRTMNGVSILYLLVVSVAVIFEFFSNVTKGESQLARISINYGFLLRNYLMLWVSLLASIVIMFAYPGLRSQLIPSVIRWYQLLLFYFLVSIPAIVLYSQDSGFSSVLLIHTLLPLGILSTFPLILWSRFVMPKIRSIWVWCLLPVLVYVSFWLILWPIDLEGFPYDLLV